MTTVPPEIWSQIFCHACVDTGYTGCSISETCRFFNDIGKSTKFRSVALRGLPQVILFWHSIKSLPSHHLRIENMFMFVGEEEETEINHLPLSDHRQADESEADNIPAITIIDVLTAAAPSLTYLYLYLGIHREAFFLPIDFPLLSELVISGHYTDHYNTQIRRFPTLANLRRLRISNPRGFGDEQAILAIPTCAPYLTHLRIDRRNSSANEFITAVQSALQLSPELSASTDNPPRSQGPVELKFPVSLKKLLIHPGVVYIPQCGFGAMNLQRAQFALRRLVESDSRIFLYCYDQQGDKDAQLKSLKEWLDRIDGKMAYWAEK